MHIRGLLFCGGAIAWPLALTAQQSTPAAPARIAGIAPPSVQPAANSASPLRTPGTVFHGNVPLLVLSDGRVFADFGWGYEQVVRSCELPVSYGSQVSLVTPPVQPVVVQPTVSQPTVNAPPALPYTPPVPAQQTASQQMQAQNVRPAQPNQTIVNTRSCWAVGAGGRVLVGWP